MYDNSNNMHYGAFGETFRLAKMLRRNMTETPDFDNASPKKNFPKFFIK